MWSRITLSMVLIAALGGCLHGRAVHTVPVERDYATLEKLKAPDVDEIVDAAHRVGAEHFAPYEYASARNYLAWAHMERDEANRKGEWDYAALAQQYAQEAIDEGSGIPDAGVAPIPDTLEECQAWFDRLKARYLELDPCKAQLVAPVVYAHVEANLSLAEHELVEKMHHTEAARYLRLVEPDINAIWAKDFDGDGVADMTDGEPWIPEDADAYEDQDGIPEPKPYPVLGAVYFNTDSAALCAFSKGYLRGIAKMLIDGYSEATVYIVGHTDSDASDDYNLDLSLRRVEALKACLVENGAKNPMVSSTYKGESQPAADNSTAAGKAKNRRVEIRLDSPDVKSPYCND